MKKLFVGFLVIVSLTPFIINGAGAKIDLGKEKKILLEKDREISKASAKKGILKAFYPFMTEQSVLLPETGHPVHGKEACGKLMNQVSEGTLQWEPLLADISAAGDLGYTHGRFERPAANGYYLTIWEKTPGGHWKVAFSQGLVLIKGLNQKPIGKQIDPAKADPATRQVLAAEKAFSDYSVKHGTIEAFYRFIADNGMALSPAGPPRTKETFAKAIAEAKKKKETDAPKGKLEWQALFAHVSASGDMAYNYGTYDYSVTDARGRTRVFHGYFVTVWKKQPDSGWKFLLDGGNQSH